MLGNMDRATLSLVACMWVAMVAGMLANFVALFLGATMLTASFPFKERHPTLAAVCLAAAGSNILLVHVFASVYGIAYAVAHTVTHASRSA